MGELKREPQSYKEAISGPDAEHWLKAIDEELQRHADYGTWKLVDKPSDRKLIGWKWVFRIKRDVNGEIRKYKARLCAKGFSQIAGVDVNHTFAPVISFKSLRTLFAVAAVEDLDLCHMDVKVAFLNGVPFEDERVFMSVPAGLDASSGQVCELRAVRAQAKSPNLEQ